MTELTDEQKRVKLAEWRGWTMVSVQRNQSTNEDYLYGRQPDGEHCAAVPDWFGDLNATHEAEKALLAGRQTYLNALAGTDFDDGWTLAEAGNAVFATARQRAEALGKTLGLW